MEEEWRDVVGYEGLYQVSNLGRIKSLNRIDSRGNKVNEKILKQEINKKNYMRVTLCKNSKMKHFLVHRLVAEAFIPNLDNLPYVNHKDENPANNKVNNLEWCTAEYNSNYGNHNKKLSENHADFSNNKHPRAKKIKCITTNEIFTTIKEAGELYNIDKSTISKCCNGKLKSAGKHPITGEKLVWKYV